MLSTKEYKYVKLLFIILLLYSTPKSFAQTKQIHSLDTTFFSDLVKLTSAKIALDDQGKTYITGQFLAYDSAGYPRQPYFIKNSTDSNFQYIEEGTGFVIYGFVNHGICFDSSNIYTVGTVNDKKVICKTDKLGNIIWAKRQSHHSYTDILYDEGKLIVTGQDENSSGEHTILISKIDTSGILISSKNYSSGNGFDDASKVIKSDSSYILIGNSYDDSTNSFGIFLTSSDKNLNFEWSKTFYRHNLNHIISGAIYNRKRREIIIAGTVTRNQFLDSIFVMKTTEMGDLIYYKHYKNNDSIHYKSTAIDIDSTGNVFVSIEQKYDLYQKALLTKLDTNGSVLWVKNYTTDTTSSEVITDIKIQNNEMLHILGNHKKIDSIATINKQYFTLKVDLDSGYWSCDSSESLLSFQKNILFHTNFNEENYLGTFLNYGITLHEDKFHIESILTCEDTTTPPPPPPPPIKNINSDIQKVISFSNPSNNYIYIFNQNEYVNLLHFNIYNISGQRITSTQQGIKKIPTTEMKSGIYFIHTMLEDNILQKDKIIIINQ